MKLSRFLPVIHAGLAFPRVVAALLRENDPDVLQTMNDIQHREESIVKTFFTVVFLACVALGPLIYWGVGKLIRAEPLQLETALAVKAGLFAHMSELGVASVERNDETLTVTMNDGIEKEVDVCAWNEAVERLGGCTWYTPGHGRYYKLTAGAKTAYSGDSHKAGESAEYVLSWLQSDMAEIKKAVRALKDEQSRRAAADASWPTIKSATATK